MDSLEKLLDLTGVSSEYVDYAGQRHQVPREDRLRVLRAAGYPVDDCRAVDELVFRLDASPWKRWLRAFHIVDEVNLTLAVHCHPGQLAFPLHWQVTTESGDKVHGMILPEESPESGNYVIDDVRYSARVLDLPRLPTGYHHISVTNSLRTEEAMLIVCPRRCHGALDEGERLWGVSCHLYTLRSGRNWGIGDFTDLCELVDFSAAAGANLIGLNPLHAPCADSPDPASPYGSSDRRFLNPLYIDPERVEEFTSGGRARALVNDPAVSGLRVALRNKGLVNHDQVSALKYRLYEALFQDFIKAHGNGTTARGAAFQGYVAAKGETLEVFCHYEMTHNPHATQWCRQPRFFAYLQWLAEEQLEECQRHAIERGMRIGLLGDLAVGAVAHGSEVQTNPQLYLPSVTIGAPPDPFSSTGQDWGLPVMNPVAIRDNHFAHFISLLRANMAHVGALRIDHIMSLMRLWWCLPEEGGAPRRGVYVYYPSDELLSLVRLESWRSRCLVVGEDMGVVPAEIRHAMNESGIYGNNLLYFEQHRDRRFKSPAEHRVNALFMVTNHDVPTLRDWWQGSDLERRFELRQIPTRNELETRILERDIDKGHLLQWLEDNHLLPGGWNLNDLDKAFDFTLCDAIHCGCARSASQLMLLQLEDLQMLTDPLNIPGTYQEYPNWRRKQGSTTQDIFASPDVQRLLANVSEERQC